MKTRWLVASLIALASTVALAQEKFVLENKYQADETFAYKMQAAGNGSIQVTRGDRSERVPIEIEMTLELVTTVESVEEDGSAHLKTKFVRIQRMSHMPTKKSKVVLTIDKKGVRLERNGQVLYSPAKPGNTKLQRRMKALSVLTEHAMTLHVAKDGKVLGYDAPLAFRSAGGQELNLSQVAQNSQPVLPSNPVGVGDSWSSDLSIQVPNIATANVSNKLTLAGIKQIGAYRCAAIAMEGVTTPDALQEGLRLSADGDAAKVEQLDQSTKGTLYFAIKEGRMVRKEFQTALKVAMSQTAGEGDAQTVTQREIDVTFDITMQLK